MNIFLSILLTLMALFLIMLILIQRGRGGGLSGALTGMGGNSAFGSKSGDMFTKITMWSAFLWIVLCAVSVKYMGSDSKKSLIPDTPEQPKKAPLNPGTGGGVPADNNSNAPTK